MCRAFCSHILKRHKVRCGGKCTSYGGDSGVPQRNSLGQRQGCGRRWEYIPTTARHPLQPYVSRCADRYRTGDWGGFCNDFCYDGGKFMLLLPEPSWGPQEYHRSGCACNDFCSAACRDRAVGAYSAAGKQRKRHTVRNGKPFVARLGRPREHCNTRRGSLYGPRNTAYAGHYCCARYLFKY